MISRTTVLASFMLAVGAYAGYRDENDNLAAWPYNFAPVPVCRHLDYWKYADGIDFASSNTNKNRDPHHNKTKRVKTNDVSNKNFNCGYCRKKTLEVAQCVGEAWHAAQMPSGNCKDAWDDLQIYCHGDATQWYVKSVSYVVAWSGFPCNDGPLLAYAKLASSISTKDVKKLTCKVCNGVMKSLSKCVVGNDFPEPGEATGDPNDGIDDVYEAIYEPCINDIGTLVTDAAFCKPYECGLTVDKSRDQKIVGWSGYAKLLDTSVWNTGSNAGEDKGFTCETIMGAFLRSSSSDRASIYSSRYSGVGTYSKVYFD